MRKRSDRDLERWKKEAAGPSERKVYRGESLRAVAVAVRGGE